MDSEQNSSLSVMQIGYIAYLLKGSEFYYPYILLYWISVDFTNEGPCKILKYGVPTLESNPGPLGVEQDISTLIIWPVISFIR